MAPNIAAYRESIKRRAARWRLLSFKPHGIRPSSTLAWRAAVLVARWIGIVSTAWRVIRSGRCSTDGGSADAHGHPAAHGCTTVNAAPIDTTVINASATNSYAPSICESVS
jgi:hypothetical protein